MDHRSLITVLIVLASFNLKSQSENELAENFLVEIDELIVDQTITKGGRDFYEIFYNEWIWPESEQSFTIYIKERPARANSTQVQIFVDELLVFESFLQPRFEELLQLNEFAQAYVQNHMISYDEIIRQLQGEDMSGTGIF
jgi:curli production assembly/transport component CsgE